MPVSSESSNGVQERQYSCSHINYYLTDNITVITVYQQTTQIVVLSDNEILRIKT